MAKIKDCKEVSYIECGVCGTDIYQCEHCKDVMVDVNVDQIEGHCIDGSHYCEACHHYLEQDGHLRSE